MSTLPKVGDLVLAGLESGLHVLSGSTVVAPFTDLVIEKKIRPMALCAGL